jgi:hypothetical protein
LKLSSRAKNATPKVTAVPTVNSTAVSRRQLRQRWRAAESESAVGVKAAGTTSVRS